jgi:hypothetical protein
MIIILKCDAMLFGNRIRQLREEKQMLQRQFLCKVSANRTCSSLPNRSQNGAGQYKVLAAFKYIEQLILTINISEEAQNEIPE